MSLILAVSTSSARGSVAVLRGDEPIARVAYEGGNAHAERLFAAIDAAMEQAGVTRSALGAIACDVGPGSFTGVRVGVSACQGIALALGLPAVGVGSLEAMVHAARHQDAGQGGVLAVLDARKDELFVALHRPDGSVAWGPLHLPCADAAGELGAAMAAHAPAAIVVGEMAAAVEELAPPLRGESLDLPDAAVIGRCAAARLRAEGPGPFDAANLEPVYVRPPDARPLAFAVPREGLV